MKRAFTMLELMLAVVLLALMTLTTTWTFRSILRNWELSTEMADQIKSVDYSIERVLAALRSAYFPSNGENKKNINGTTPEDYGFMLLDGGDQNDESDTIEWLKVGPAIVGENSRFSNSPHRITLYVRDERDANEDFPAGLVAEVIEEKRFRSQDNFDEDDANNWDHFLIDPNVQGFNCRVIDKDQPYLKDHANWVDTWDTSNCIPRRVQLTFWMKPTDGTREPYPIVREIEIPLWEISQKDLSETEDEGAKRPGTTSESGEAPSEKTGGKSPAGEGKSPPPMPGTAPAGGAPGGPAGGGGR